MELIDDFQPPDGTRFIWHSQKSKDLWFNRVQRISAGQGERERESVARGMRDLCLQPVSRGIEYQKLEAWARNRGLHVMPIREVGRFDGFAHRYTAGSDMFIVALSRYAECAEDPKPEQFLGYPDCCAEFFFNYFPRYIDPIWQWAGAPGDKRE